MSIWTRITAAVSALAKGEGLSAVFDHLRSPPERSIAFTIAVIALGAKMAKADGQVTRDEVAAFREVFQIAREDEAGAARVFNLARQDVAGFEEYAAKISAMFGTDREALCDLMEGLFHIALADGAYHPAENIFLVRVAEIFGLAGRPFDRIRARFVPEAMADGTYHPNEDDFLARVAAIFELPEARFRLLRSRFVPDAAPDPYEILGVAHDAPMEAIRAAWRRAVRETHPDRMIARGVPPEALKLAESRMVAINKAWEQIEAEHAG